MECMQRRPTKDDQGSAEEEVEGRHDSKESCCYWQQRIELAIMSLNYRWKDTWLDIRNNLYSKNSSAAESVAWGGGDSINSWFNFELHP